jgi:hypothetical protein
VYSLQNRIRNPYTLICGLGGSYERFAKYLLECINADVILKNSLMTDQMPISKFWQNESTLSTVGLVPYCSELSIAHQEQPNQICPETSASCSISSSISSFSASFTDSIQIDGISPDLQNQIKFHSQHTFSGPPRQQPPPYNSLLAVHLRQAAAHFARGDRAAAALELRAAAACGVASELRAVSRCLRVVSSADRRHSNSRNNSIEGRCFFLFFFSFEWRI